MNPNLIKKITHHYTIAANGEIWRFNYTSTSYFSITDQNLDSWEYSTYYFSIDLFHYLLKDWEKIEMIHNAVSSNNARYTLYLLHLRVKEGDDPFQEFLKTDSALIFLFYLFIPSTWWNKKFDPLHEDLLPHIDNLEPTDVSNFNRIKSILQKHSQILQSEFKKVSRENNVIFNLDGFFTYSKIGCG